jgi:hypothetical protein
MPPWLQLSAVAGGGDKRKSCRRAGDFGGGAGGDFVRVVASPIAAASGCVPARNQMTVVGPCPPRAPRSAKVRILGLAVCVGVGRRTVALMGFDGGCERDEDTRLLRLAEGRRASIQP